MSGSETVARVSREQAERLGAGEGALPLSGRRVSSDGPVRIVYRLAEGRLRRRLAALGPEVGEVSVPERAMRSSVEVPAQRQVYRNNCETATLSMLLASQGVEEGQRALQREVRHEGPLDPRTVADGETVWGDPERGYVGRVEGGGVAGGFGVYEGPIIDLARRWVEPVDLSGQPPEALYERLLRGRPVLAWVGLQDGPYESWRNERGDRVTVNFGEHTVLLVGISGGRLLVNDPLDGQRKWWSKSQFEEMWRRLDERAISV